MRKGRRSVERLFYWGPRDAQGAEGARVRVAGEADATILSASSMLCVLAIVCVLSPMLLWAQGPALTTINDTVYRADGTAAKGTALISWPTFQTAEGNAVAAGTKTATIAAAGAFPHNWCRMWAQRHRERTIRWFFN